MADDSNWQLCTALTIGNAGVLLSIMAEEEPQEVSKYGHKLTCTVCEHGRFWSRRTLMNTKGATFFGFDWANREAVNYVCERCGYVFWFLER